MGAATPSEEALRTAKNALRETILARRDSLDAAVCGRQSRHITEQLLALPAYRSAEFIAAYASFGSEFDTAAFLKAVLHSGRRLLLPRINRTEKALELREVDDLQSDLVSGMWGIREPTEHCRIVPASQVEFMLVPGVAFTRNGERLGYGGGFYDRLLTELPPDVPRVAAAFSLQVVQKLPTGPRDQRVHRIVTEDEVIGD